MTYRASKNVRAKKRVGFFVIGYSTIIIGLLMFVIDSFIVVSEFIFPTLALITWVMGPILMLIGFYVRTESDSPHLAQSSLEVNNTQLVKPEQEQKIERPS